MNYRDAIAWFKRTFHTRIMAGLDGTPFSVDLVVAIATQETSYIWWPLVDNGLSEADVLRLCVGDTLDADKGRRAFPRTREDLLAAPRGEEMFAIAREVLVELARQRDDLNFVFKRPEKFCHGFGIFQYDLQFYRKNPDFFLRRQWQDFDACLELLVIELNEALARQGWTDKRTLTDEEQVYVAIAYNKGVAKLSLGFKQGHQACDGRFYGENINEYLRISQSVGVIGEAPRAIMPGRGAAPLPAPTMFKKIGVVFEVVVQESALRLRSEPRIPKDDPAGNVIARLPAGQLVQRLSPKLVGEFMEVETSLNGAYYRGWASSTCLRRVKRAKVVREGEEEAVSSETPPTAVPPKPVEVPVALPEPVEPTSGIVAVYMPRAAGSITRRTQPASALSLNEPNQPCRKGTTAAERSAELAAIIDWLAVDKPAHKRYQPRGPTTFCNIYTHDYCFLAGVYLPRVWWTPDAIERLAKGETVEPLYEKTIDEQRANDLFRWFRAFGLRFGWRQTGTVSKLQEAANLGGIGIIVARRKEDGRSGHIVAVVPETAEWRAKRDSNGNVIGPLQSQAGTVNFRYRAVTNEWWRGSQFADHAFWIHA
ncbi:MAG TPA: hypothetical protein VG095_08350 [Chthoniobacterales bacterium]|nr:hypothetical protein [Chthoniobacterales bacterium]